MTVRDQNLETTGAFYAAFKVHQTANSDDLTDADIGKAVTILGNYEVGPGSDGNVLLGKLIDLGGIMTLPATTTVPSVGNRVVVDGSGSVKQAPALAADDPAGGNVARGTVIDVNGTSEVTLILN